MATGKGAPLSHLREEGDADGNLTSVQEGWPPGMLWNDCRGEVGDSPPICPSEQGQKLTDQAWWHKAVSRFLPKTKGGLVLAGVGLPGSAPGSWGRVLALFLLLCSFLPPSLFLSPFFRDQSIKPETLLLSPAFFLESWECPDSEEQGVRERDGVLK